MMCPVCKRELAPTLSICFACGAMVHDTVREELQTKVGRVSNPLEHKVAVEAEVQMYAAPQSEPVIEKPAIVAPIQKVEVIEPPQPKAVKIETSELFNKKTSPTLVGFQSKNTTVPDWRLQLQNSVRQRKSDVPVHAQAIDGAGIGFQKQLVTNGANALKPQYVEEPESVSHANPRVANALRRIEDSRKRFTTGTATVETAAATQPAPARNYPFNVVARSGGVSPKPAVQRATVNTPPKPRLVSSLRIEKKAYDTNKLPPIPQLEKVEPVIEDPITAKSILSPDARMNEHFKIDVPAGIHEIHEIEAIEDEELDDLAPLASRFTAGLFDIIIGGFATGIVLSPMLLSGGAWFSIAGFLAMAAAFGIVMFVYLTASIGFRGRTLGMKLFSLEIVDAEENEYPSIHQAAVNSAVFLLALPFLGIGFLPAFMNEERRAAHDLISGTILVREI
ncbi:MAG TPA: RDD family protein [Pyrinomonadaceae bacterium]|nr:RDD family protein [Pyrinomonadaceae bacterium]